MAESKIYLPVDKTVSDAFAKSLWEHISNVQEAGNKLSVPIERLIIHDHSKWSAEEFPAYARHFHGGGDPVNFAKAWLHHLQHNDHHWQHWIFPDGYNLEGANLENGVMEMPVYAALEMIADWLGTSKTYTGSWDMSDWLTKNIPKITVHSKTAKYLRETLDILGYADIIYTHKFANELRVTDG